MLAQKKKRTWCYWAGLILFTAAVVNAQAPDPPFPSLLSSDGARHKVNSAIYLGTSVDGECDAGNDQDEDDGIQFLSPLTGNRTLVIAVQASLKGYINGWIDLNGDGDWRDDGEHLLRDARVNAGKTLLSVFIKSVNSQKLLYARFRYSSESGLSFTGWAPDGEVEDYALRFMDEDATEAGFITKIGVSPEDYTLENNYPNPFNPETTIPFQLKEAGYVRLDVYNIKGEHVRTLVNDHRAAGRYLTSWNGVNEQGLLQSSGTYLIHFRVNGFSQTRRMEFLK